DETRRTRGHRGRLVFHRGHLRLLGQSLRARPDRRHHPRRNHADRRARLPGRLDSPRRGGVLKSNHEDTKTRSQGVVFLAGGFAGVAVRGGGAGRYSTMTLLTIAIGRPGAVYVIEPSARSTVSFSPRR